MKKVLSFIKDALSSGDGASSKRLITFIVVLALIVSLFVAQLFGKVAPEFMFLGMRDVAMFGLGAVATEIAGKFAKSSSDDKQT